MATENYGGEARRVAFFKDGDLKFNAVKLTITRQRYKSFETLLNELNGKVPLPYGVRSIHTPAGRHNVTQLDQLQDGQQYVCSTHVGKKIRRIDYSQIQKKKLFKIARPSSGQAPIEMSSIDEARLLQKGEKPKVVRIHAQGDVTKHGKLILNRRTAPSIEVVFQHVSEILQMKSGPVSALYTLNGRKIASLKELMEGPEILLACGKYDQRPDRNDGGSLPAILSSGDVSSHKSSVRKSLPARVERKKNTKRLKASSGATYKEWLITIETTDSPEAACNCDVFFVLYGDCGQTDEIFLGKPGSNGYRAGEINEAEMKIKDVGAVYKIRIWHDNTGNKPSWHIKKLLFTNMASNEEVMFQCNRWLSEVHDDGQIVREFPAMSDSESSLPVVKYEVKIYTGDEVGSGTDSNIFLNIIGERGDTGKRMLNKSKAREFSFQRGGVDLFVIEAVQVGKIKRIDISRDKSGAALGWFLEQVKIKEENSQIEHIFFCHRWLAKDKDDGKSERSIEAVLSKDSSNEKDMMMDDLSWKLCKNRKVELYAKTTGLAICCDPKTLQVHCAGKGNKCCCWIVKEGKDASTRTLYSREARSYLSVDGSSMLMTRGNPGLLNEFVIRMHADDCASFESAVFSGRYIGYSSASKLLTCVDGSSDFRLFNVSHLGGIAENQVLKVISKATRKAIFVTDGRVGWASDKGDKEESYFTAKKTATDVVALQSNLNKMFIRVHKKELDCKGSSKSDTSCQFMTHRDRIVDEYRLESLKMRGLFLAASHDGKNLTMSAATDMRSSFMICKSSDSCEEELHPPNAASPRSQLCELPVPVHDKNIDDANVESNDSASEDGSEESSRSLDEVDLRSSFVASASKEEEEYSDASFEELVSAGSQASSYSATYATLDDSESDNYTNGGGGDTNLEEAGLLSGSTLDQEQQHLDQAFVSATDTQSRINSQETSDLVSEASDAGENTVKMDSSTSNSMDDETLIRNLPLQYSSGNVPRSCSARLNVPKAIRHVLARRPHSTPIKLAPLPPRGARPPSSRRSPTQSDSVLAATQEEDRNIDSYPAKGNRSTDEEDPHAPSTTQEGNLDVLMSAADDGHLWAARNDVRDVNVTDELQPNHHPSLDVHASVLHDEDESDERLDAKESTTDIADCSEHDQVACDMHDGHYDKNEEQEYEAVASQLVADVIFKAMQYFNSTPEDFKSTDEVRNDAMSDNKDVLENTFVGCQSESINNLADDEIPTVSSSNSEADNDSQRSSAKDDEKGHMWRIYVKTSPFKDAGTTSNVYLVIFGSEGDSGLILLGDDNNDGRYFQAGATNVFEVDVGNIGEIFKLRVGHSNSGANPSWHLQNIVMKSPCNREDIEFTCNRWLSRCDDDCDIVREIPRVQQHGTKLLVLHYEATVVTGAEKDCDLNGRAFINIFGYNGDCGDRAINPFGEELNCHREQTSIIEAVDLGIMKSIVIGHDSSGKKNDWYVEFVKVKIVEREEEYVFPCYRWFSLRKGDGKTIRELKVEEFDWVLTVTTGRISAPDASPLPTLVAYGEFGRSDTIDLPVRKNMFKPGHSDSFKIFLGELGELFKIRLENRLRFSSSPWFVEELQLQNRLNLKSFRWTVQKWLGKISSDCAFEIPVSRVEAATLPVSLYTVNLFLTSMTCRKADHCNIYVLLDGQLGDSGKRFVLPSEDLELLELVEEQQVWYTILIEAVYLARITRLTVGLDDSSLQSKSETLWHCQHITVSDSQHSDTTYIFDGNFYLGAHPELRSRVLTKFRIDGTDPQPILQSRHIII